MITDADGTEMARNVDTLNQPLRKWKLTSHAPSTPPPAMSSTVYQRRQCRQPPARFWPALTDS